MAFQSECGRCCGCCNEACSATTAAVLSIS